MSKSLLRYRRLRKELTDAVNAEYLPLGIHDSSTLTCVDLSISQGATIKQDRTGFEKSTQFVEGEALNLHLLIGDKQGLYRPSYVCIFLGKKGERRYDQENGRFSRPFLKALRFAKKRLGLKKVDFISSSWRVKLIETINQSSFKLVLWKEEQKDQNVVFHTNIWSANHIPKPDFWEKSGLVNPNEDLDSKEVEANESLVQREEVDEY